MGETIQLAAKDGHRLAAYRADPGAPGALGAQGVQGAPDITPRAAAPPGRRPAGGIVVIQEIFGVNGHMRAVCDGFAADGYLAIAPALFDRLQPGVQLGYGPDDIAAGRALRGRLKWDDVMADCAAAVAALAPAGRVGIVGYCYGGGVAWVAAGRVAGLAAAVGYYGGPWVEFKTLPPRCPALLHFAAKDTMIPVGLADEMKRDHPTIATHVYDADHGFNCDQRAHYDAAAATLARRRTLAFFAATIG